LKIGIFGGAFNPPHTGHVSAAQAACGQLGLELLIVVPTGLPPHKTLPSDTPCSDARMIMAQNAFKSFPNAVVSDIELSADRTSYTIDTVNAVLKDYPGAELYLLIGTDMYLIFETWKDAGILLKSVTPAVLSRSSRDTGIILEHMKVLNGKYGAAAVTVENDSIEISSSKLREMLPKRKGAAYLTNDNYSYIIMNRLYGAQPEWEWLRRQAYLMLDPVRVPHVAACETEAVRLAERWGADPDDAREAAILHDITKRLDLDGHMCILSEHGITIGKLAFGEEKLLHSVTGSILAGSVFGASNTVTGAIKWHTTGRAGMTTLEKVIYLADYIESTRDFYGVDELREEAYNDLDAAMISGLKISIDDMLSRGITPNDASLDALDDLRAMKGTY